MKIFNPTLLTICTLTAVLLSLSTCKKDTVKTDITGTWFHDTKGTAWIQREAYQFNADSTMLFTRTILDTAHKQTLGYNYKLTGKYSLSGTTLKQYQLIAYVDMNTTMLPYTSLQSLVQTSTTTEQTLTIKFNADKRSFNIIYPPCPPNANCIAVSPLYIKQ